VHRRNVRKTAGQDPLGDSSPKPRTGVKTPSIHPALSWGIMAKTIITAKIKGIFRAPMGKFGSLPAEEWETHSARVPKKIAPP